MTTQVVIPICNNMLHPDKAYGNRKRTRPFVSSYRYRPPSPAKRQRMEPGRSRAMQWEIDKRRLEADLRRRDREDQRRREEARRQEQLRLKKEEEYKKEQRRRLEVQKILTLDDEEEKVRRFLELVATESDTRGGTSASQNQDLGRQRVSV